MRKYILSATLDGSTTSFAIAARNDDHAKSIAYQEISKRYVGDKRWDKGEITLTTQHEKNNKIIEIKEEG